MKLQYFIVAILFTFNPVCGQTKNGRIQLIIKGIHNRQGNVSINLFNKEQGFPDKYEKSYKWEKVKILSDTLNASISDVPYGTYAISILHDENENGKMDKNFLGIPREGCAFSNNVKPVLKSPSFEEATFRFNTEILTLELNMIYF